jgi:hypothetical protein
MILQTSLASLVSGHVIEFAVGGILSLQLWSVRAIAEVRAKSRANHQTMFGETGDNGINGTVKDHSRKLDDLLVRVARLEP